MPEFEYVVLDTIVRGVCATDATDEVIQAAIQADFPNAKAGEERRLEVSQIVYTLVPVPGEPAGAQLPALAAPETAQSDVAGEPVANVTATVVEAPAPVTGEPQG